MKVKGPKNQADFIEVLYVVFNALHGYHLLKYMGLWLHNSSNTEVIPIGSE